MTFDKKALEALRTKFGDDHGGSIHDPKFRAVADRIFSVGGTRSAPYAGLPTLLDAPYQPVDATDPDFGDLQVALIEPVPPMGLFTLVTLRNELP